MNCKPGDLAIQVRSVVGNEGKLYTVLYWVGDYVFVNGTVGRNCWCVRCEQRTVGSCGIVREQGEERVIPDAWIRPIRDQDGEDESLTWTPSPVKKEETTQ